MKFYDKRRVWIRCGAGIILSLVFLLLSLSRVDLARMVQTCRDVRKLPLFFSLLMMLASDGLRAVRWKYLLLPMKRIRTCECFSSLMIGYAANTLLPIRLGELLKAYIIGKKHAMRASSVFATVVVERVLDSVIVALFIVLVWTSFPLPDWFKRAAMIAFLALFFLCLFLLAA